MKITKAQALKIRENADALLKKMEEEEKSEVKKVMLSYQNLNGDISKLFQLIQGDTRFEKIAVGLQQMSNTLSGAIRSLEIDNTPVITAVKDLQKTILMSAPRDSSKEVIKAIERLNTSLSKVDNKGIDRTDELLDAIKSIKLESPQIEFPDTINVGNFPIQKIPQPVTHMSINALRGFVHTTATTVTNTLKPLPGYGVLDDRRAVLIYNNDSSATLYIGGSDLTTSNGMPVPPQSYSPILDAGVETIVYGITTGASINVRVLEISDENSGR